MRPTQQACDVVAGPIGINYQTLNCGKCDARFAACSALEWGHYDPSFFTRWYT